MAFSFSGSECALRRNRRQGLFCVLLTNILRVGREAALLDETVPPPVAAGPSILVDGLVPAEAGQPGLRRGRGSRWWWLSPDGGLGGPLGELLPTRAEDQEVPSAGEHPLRQSLEPAPREPREGVH